MTAVKRKAIRRAETKEGAWDKCNCPWHARCGHRHQSHQKMITCLREGSSLVLGLEEISNSRTDADDKFSLKNHKPDFAQLPDLPSD